MPPFFTSARNFSRRRGKVTKSACRLISKAIPNIFAHHPRVVYPCIEILIKGKSKSIPVTGREDP
jgi:IMP cyclohydrolase